MGQKRLAETGLGLVTACKQVGLHQEAGALTPHTYQEHDSEQHGKAWFLEEPGTVVSWTTYTELALEWDGSAKVRAGEEETQQQPGKQGGRKEPQVSIATTLFSQLGALGLSFLSQRRAMEAKKAENGWLWDKVQPGEETQVRIFKKQGGLQSLYLFICHKTGRLAISLSVTKNSDVGS